MNNHNDGYMWLIRLNLDKANEGLHRAAKEIVHLGDLSESHRTELTQGLADARSWVEHLESWLEGPLANSDE
jgi:hypothetical protein